MLYHLLTRYSLKADIMKNYSSLNLSLNKAWLIVYEDTRKNYWPTGFGAGSDATENQAAGCQNTMLAYVYYVSGFCCSKELISPNLVIKTQGTET